MSNCEWKIIKTIELRKDDVAMLENGKVVVRRKVEKPEPVPTEIDVTDECTLELVKSTCSDGYYCAINHKNHKRIFALGVDEKSKIISMSGNYFIRKAEGATVSFRVFKEV